uniref:Mitochondrial inner membrane protease ATP23 n=1 Tax=Leersia perrieri TaxID=77586 RepID=A0A0D9VFY3_9ORYZ
MAGVDGNGVPEATGMEASSGSGPPRNNHCMPFEDCVAGIISAFQQPTLRFLREQMEKAGCPVLLRMIRAMNCTSTNRSGSYCSGKGIRANHLSGNCHYKRELLRGFMKIRGQEQECVKRRSLMSVRNNPYCSNSAAKDAVEAVWDICYNDTRPFDRAP